MLKIIRPGLTLLFAPFTALLLSAVTLGPTRVGQALYLLLITLTAIPLLLLWRANTKPFLRTIGVASTLLAVVTLIRLPLAEARVRTKSLKNLSASASNLLSLIGVAPEADQVILGTYLLPKEYPVSPARAAQLREIMKDAYAEMERDPTFRPLSPVTQLALADLSGLPFESDHLYSYAPPHPTDEKLPTVIFVHGFMGNFQLYLWMMKRFADRYHCAVVLPTFGAGRWYQRGGTAAIERAREYALKNLSADASRIYLVGLSNGGLGVTRAGMAHPSHYAGLGYVSAVMEETLFTKPSFIKGWRGRPVFVVYGGHENFISTTALARHTKRLENLGATVSQQVYPSEDHFLLLTQLDSVLADVAGWMRVAKKDGAERDAPHTHSEQHAQRE